MPSQINEENIVQNEPLQNAVSRLLARRHDDEYVRVLSSVSLIG